MNRHERRGTAVQMREQAKAWPAQLTEVPRVEWPAPVHAGPRPLAVWRSRRFFAQLYEAPPLGTIQVLRLTVNRVTIGGDGQFQDNITWDELQACKRETGHGDCYAVEVYPADRDIKHIANMRHLWLLSEPLAIGWFS